MKKFYVLMLLLCTSCSSVLIGMEYRNDAVLYASKEFNCHVLDIEVYPYTGGENAKKFLVKGCGKRINVICQKNDKTEIVECSTL